MSEITLKGCQEVVDEWVRTIGVRYYSELTNTAVLMEEVGEVARIMSRVYGEQSFKKSDEDYNLADEFADVLFVLICLANQTGVDLTEAFHRNMEKKTNRNGYGNAIIGRYGGCFEEGIRGLCVKERIISRGLDAPVKFAPTLEVRKGNARYRRG
jgi:NTP pyrophosphatase (non-canonical NTP hydrolase)